MTNRLQWDVLVSVQIPVVTSDLPPGAIQEGTKEDQIR
jgi:hypothetical protein